MYTQWYWKLCQYRLYSYFVNITSDQLCNLLPSHYPYSWSTCSSGVHMLHTYSVQMYILGMRTRISCLAPASQCVCKQSAEAARSHALLTAHEARLFTNLRARTAAYEWRKLTFLSVTNWYSPSVTNWHSPSMTNWHSLSITNWHSPSVTNWHS